MQLCLPFLLPKLQLSPETSRKIACLGNFCLLLGCDRILLFSVRCSIFFSISKNPALRDHGAAVFVLCLFLGGLAIAVRV